MSDLPPSTLPQLTFQTRTVDIHTLAVKYYLKPRQDLKWRFNWTPGERRHFIHLLTLFATPKLGAVGYPVSGIRSHVSLDMLTNTTVVLLYARAVDLEEADAVRGLRVRDIWRRTAIILPVYQPIRFGNE